MDNQYRDGSPYSHSSIKVRSGGHEKVLRDNICQQEKRLARKSGAIRFILMVIILYLNI